MKGNLYLIQADDDTNTTIAAGDSLSVLSRTLKIPLRTLQDGARTGHIRSRGFLVECVKA